MSRPRLAPVPRRRGLASLILAGWALLAAPAIAQDVAEPEPTLVTMGTAAITGVYFPVGVALCRLVNQHRADTGLRCSAVPTDGSVGNIESMRQGTMDFAIVQSDSQAQAVAGVGPFAAGGPDTGLRSVIALYPEPLTLVARADAGIARVEDLAGKRVWLGAPGSGTRALAGALVAALGWTPASFAAAPDLPADSVAAALCHGDLDAFFLAIGHPALAVQEATTSCDARLVPIDGAAIDALIAASPGLAAATIPGNLYRGNPAPVASFGAEATLVTRADEPEDRLHAILGQMLGDLDTLRGLEPVLAGFDPAAMAAGPLAAPLHPGAERYFRERGWLN